MASNYKGANLSYQDIRVGEVYSFARKISRKDIMNFAKLSGDFNRLHIKDNVVHGMLSGSLFSTLVGMYCPGERSLYVSQTLNFRKILCGGDSVIVRGTVVGKVDSVRIVILKTEILNLKDSKIMVDGEAKIKVLEHE